MAGFDDQIQFANEAAQQTYKAVLTFFGNNGQQGFVAQKTATALSAVVLIMAVLVSVILGVMFRIGTQITALFLETMGEARQSNQDALNSLIAASMSDLLGVQVTGSDIPAGGDPQAQVDRAVVIGGKLIDLLTQEFGGNSGPDGVNGAQAAKAFAGFNINFSTSAAVLSIITNIESLGFFTEFREVGERMAESLGLGRLMRIAFKPLIDHLIAKPYDRQLANQYRQQRMTLGDVVHADAANMHGTNPLHQDLSDQGYTDADQAILIQLHAKRASTSDYLTLVRTGRMQHDEAVTRLTQQGMSEFEAGAIVDAAALNDQMTLNMSYIEDAYHLARDRHIDETAFQQILQSVSIPDAERQIWAQRLSLHLLNPIKRISLAQLLYLGERAQITDADVEAWTTAEGYTEQDAAMIQLYVLGKELDFDAAQKKIAAAAAAAAAKKAAAAAKTTTTGT